MFVTVFTFRARPGQEAGIVALHEDWQRSRLDLARGYLSGELLRGIKDSQQFVTIARFESQAASQAIASDPEQDAWFRRLTSMTEAEPVFLDCLSAWRLEEPRRAALPL